MSAFSEANNYKDLIECCHLVLDRCHEIDGKITHFGFPDARRMALASIQEMVAGLLFSFQAVITGRKAAQVRALFGAHGVAAEKAQEHTQNLWRWGLSTITHFRVDSLFQCLLTARGEYKDRSGFGNMLRQLLDVCELKDRARTEAVFLAAAYSRNSFHNNGLHRGPPLDVEIQGMRFTFERDKTAKCGSFGHVLAIVYEMMGCLEEMLLCPTLAKLTEPIPDLFLLDPTWREAF